MIRLPATRAFSPHPDLGEPNRRGRPSPCAPSLSRRQRRRGPEVRDPRPDPHSRAGRHIQFAARAPATPGSLRHRQRDAAGGRFAADRAGAARVRAVGRSRADPRRRLRRGLSSHLRRPARHPQERPHPGHRAPSGLAAASGRRARAQLDGGAAAGGRPRHRPLRRRQGAAGILHLRASPLHRGARAPRRPRHPQRAPLRADPAERGAVPRPRRQQQRGRVAARP